MPQVRCGWQITASPRLDRGDAGADVLDPAGVLVAHDERQQVAVVVHDVLPDTLDDVQVGAAEAGGADLHDDLVGLHDRGLADVLDLEVDRHRGVVFVEACSLHGIAPLACRGGPGGAGRDRITMLQRSSLCF